MKRKLILVVIAGALLLPASLAQRQGGFRGSASSVRGFGGRFHGHSHNAAARGYFLGDTAFLYDDYPFGPAIPETASPQFVFMQSPTAAVDTPSVKIASLLIELEGDRYVRYGGVARSPDPDARPRGISTLEVTSSAATIPSPTRQDLPPTVLVYRDGDRIEVADYAIVGRTIYAHRAGASWDDENAGYGLNNIQVSMLDIPSTVKANREHGISFVLPDGSNQVVTRP
jgi:hypothetical protein